MVSTRTATAEALRIAVGLCALLCTAPAHAGEPEGELSWRGPLVVQDLLPAVESGSVSAEGAEPQAGSLDALSFRSGAKAAGGGFDGCRSDLALGGTRWFAQDAGVTLRGEDEAEASAALELAPLGLELRPAEPSADVASVASGFARWREGRWGRCSAGDTSGGGFLRSTRSVDAQRANASVFVDRVFGARTIHAEYRFEHVGPAGVAAASTHGLRLRTELRRGARSQTQVAYEVQVRPTERQLGPFSLRDAISLEHSVSLPQNQRLLLNGSVGRERDRASGAVVSRDLDQLGLTAGYELKLPLELRTRIDAGVQMRRFAQLRITAGDRLLERYQTGSVSLLRPIGLSSVFVYYRRERGDSNAVLSDYQRDTIGLTFTRPL